MTDKVQKFRKEVEKLKSQLLRGACSSQIAMETRCKEEAYNEVLAILDSMQEEHVSEDLEKENKIEILADIIFNAAKHGYMPYDTQDEYCAMEIAKKNIDKFIVPKKQEKLVGEELEEAAEEWDESLYRSDAFKAGAKWMRKQMMSKAIDGIARPDDGEVWCDLKPFNFKDGDKVKVIVIKEE